MRWQIEQLMFRASLTVHSWRSCRSRGCGTTYRAGTARAMDSNVAGDGFSEGDARWQGKRLT